MSGTDFPLRANADNRFLLKYLLIGGVCLGFGLWGCYDLFVKIPAKLPIAQAWEEIKADESLKTDPDKIATAQDEAYKKIAKENGWPSKRPGADDSLEHLETLIIWQYLFIGLGFGIGLPCVIWYLRNRGTWVESTETGLKSSWGQELEFNQIQQFDKQKWDKKGIGVLTYEDKSGKHKFVVDDLKYKRTEMDQIVRLIESKIPHNLIVNGQPEPVLDESDFTERSDSNSGRDL